MFKATTSLGIPIAKEPLSNFRKFLFVLWKHLNLPDPTPVQYDIAYNLQPTARRQTNDYPSIQRGGQILDYFSLRRLAALHEPTVKHLGRLSVEVSL